MKITTSYDYPPIPIREEMNDIVGILRQSAHTHNEWPTQDVAQLFTSARDEIISLRAELDQAAGVIADRNAELAALKAQREWRPIETAPEVGWFTACTVQKEIVQARRYPNGFEDTWGGDYAAVGGLTHWQPLPAPPESGDE